MKLVVGLGNPGAKYKNTRHNVGFLVADEIEKLKLPGVVVFKPQKFMNRSGQEVKKFLKKWPACAGRKGRILPLFVGHDDLDIPVGKFKISRKGPKVHNGLKSIYEQLGTKDFWHLRIGIDADRGGKTPEEFVLSSFRPEEKKLIAQVLAEVGQAFAELPPGSNRRG